MQLKDIELVKTSKVPNIVTVLNALYQGHKIKLGRYEILLGKTKTNDEEPIIVCNDDNIIGVGDWTLAHFIRTCNNLSDEEIAIINTNCVLNVVSETGAFSTRKLRKDGE